MSVFPDRAWQYSRRPAFTTVMNALAQVTDDIVQCTMFSRRIARVQPAKGSGGRTKRAFAVVVSSTGSADNITPRCPHGDELIQTLLSQGSLFSVTQEEQTVFHIFQIARRPVTRHEAAVKMIIRLLENGLATGFNMVAGQQVTGHADNRRLILLSFYVHVNGWSDYQDIVMATYHVMYPLQRLERLLDSKPVRAPDGEFTVNDLFEMDRYLLFSAHLKLNTMEESISYHSLLSTVILIIRIKRRHLN